MGDARTAADSDRQRLFIGVPVSEAAKEEIASRLPSPLPGRVVSADKWHFTLRFLGSTDALTRARVVDALAKAALGHAFGITFGGLGAFPSAGRARVLWVGVKSGKKELEELAGRVEDALRSAGVPPEQRPFKAHLTLSRIQPPASVRVTIERGSDVRGSMQVQNVVLFRSHLGRGGSRYESVGVFPLRGGSG